MWRSRNSSGQLASGAINVSLPGGDAVVVQALDKISARGATVTLNDQELLRSADFATDLNATWKTGTLTVDVRQLVLRQGEATLLSAAVAGDLTLGKTRRASGHGSLSADFAALAKQPALAAKLPLLSGAVKVKYDVALGDGTKGKIEISGPKTSSPAKARCRSARWNSPLMRRSTPITPAPCAICSSSPRTDGVLTCCLTARSA